MKLIKHSFYNLLGLGFPLILAVFCIPILIRELGSANFGLLTLIWAVVSYFGLFDLGLGRALTQLLAVSIAKHDDTSAGTIFKTAITIMAGLGVVAGILMAVSASWGIGLIKSIPEPQEALNAAYFLSIAMPAIILTSGYRGILEAHHSFGIINAIRLPMGIYTFICPTIIVLTGITRLDVIAAALAIGRILACVVHAWYANQTLPQSLSKYHFDKRQLKPLCISGGWMTLSNIISPLMGYVDRFIIGGIISATAVAYYTTPQEIVTKLWIVPGALTSVLFPAFSAHVVSGFKETYKLFIKSICWIYLILLPITAVLTIFSYEILSAWIKKDFAIHSFHFLQIFSIGILINSLAHTPMTLIQAMGKPRITGLLHLIEFPFFIFLIWWLTVTHGPMGAALAWLIRILFDTTALYLICLYLNKWNLKLIFSYKSIIFTIATLLVYSAALIDSIMIRLLFLFVSFVISATLAIKLSPKNIRYLNKHE